MSLVGKGGLNVAGHRIPFSFLAIAVAVGAALLVVRQLRSSGSSVALGSPVGTGADQAAFDQLTASTQALQLAVGQLQALPNAGSIAAQSASTGQQVTSSSPTNVGQPINAPAPGDFLPGWWVWERRSTLPVRYAPTYPFRVPPQPIGLPGDRVAGLGTAIH